MSIPSAEEIEVMFRKIQQNQSEDASFSNGLDKYLSSPATETSPIIIGATPNALVISGADSTLQTVINARTIRKCMSAPDEFRHGHNLSAEVMKQLPQELRNPVMVLKGNEDNSLVAITELNDNEQRKIMAAISLSERQGFREVNRISSVYGRNNMANYIKAQIEQGNLVAINEEKADDMLRSLGLQSPHENTYIRFNNSISYSMENVKYPEHQFSQSASRDVHTGEKTFSEQVDDVLAGRANQFNDLKVCDTPAILLAVGCDSLPMLYTKKYLNDALKPRGDSSASQHYHDLSVEQIKRIPELLKDPVMVYDSLSRNDSIIVVTSECDKNNNPIIAAIKPNGSGKYDLCIVSANFITSIHGRENFERQVINAASQNKVLYWNKEKSQELFGRLGLQLSARLNNLDPNTIIHQSDNIVKPFEKNVSQERTLKDDMSMREVLAQYRKLEKEMQQIDYSNMTANDREMLSEYAAIKMFITDIAHAVEFTSNSMGVVRDIDGNMKVMGMMTAQEYARNMYDLTNGMDQDFMQTIWQEQYKCIPFEEHMEKVQMTEAVCRSVMSAAVIQEAIQTAGTHECTVGSIQTALERSDELMKQCGIDREQAYEDTVMNFGKMQRDNTLLPAEETEQIREEKENEPVTIVESNDGYVMNTSERVTSENSKAFSDKNGIENGNEVRHDIPRETTNSIADVRPNIKFEEASDIGSKEQTEIDSGYGTDADIEIIARTSETYEMQTDSSVQKNKNTLKHHQKNIMEM